MIALAVIVVIVGSLFVGFIAGAFYSWLWKANAKIWRDAAHAWRMRFEATD